MQRASGEDSCPGVLRLHQAADGRVARVRIPGGRLTVEQWDVLAAAARDLGSGHLDLTSRGNVQLRGLSDVAGELSDRLWQVGLLPSVSHDQARNIVASPMAGLDDRGVFDISSWISELDAAVCERPELAALSGRFLFGLDDGRGDIEALEPDLCLTATGPDQLRLSVAGSPTGPHLRPSDAITAAVRAALDFLAERRVAGSHAWRIRDLLPSIDGSPAANVDPNFPEIGVLRGALAVGARLGRLDRHQVAALRLAAVGQLIVTPWRTVVLPGAVNLADLADAGLIVDPADPWVGVTCCTGRPGCDKALADVRHDAQVLHTALSEPLPMPVHWVGCERRCGAAGMGAIEVLATGTGYRISGEHSAGFAAAIKGIE